MMANNYFGFTPGGTQYSTTAAAAAAAAAYQTGTSAAGYAVGHATPAAATYTTQQAAAANRAYDTTYQAAVAANPAAATYAAAGATTPVSTAFDYASYGRTAQAAAVSAAYDGTKTYYQQPAAVAAAAAATYTTPDTHYQDTTFAAAKPAYTVNSYPTATVATIKPAAAASKPAYSAAGYTAATVNNYAMAYTNPQAAVAATVKAKPNIVAVQQATALPQAAVAAVAAAASNASAVKPAATWQTYKKAGLGLRRKPTIPPKTTQLHYCEVCKISCAGPQTYREHLEGQKHKKKETAAKAGSSSGQRNGNSLRCELCDVTCTGSDAYTAHIRGAKHQKVVKLHTKLGKPIPSTDPVVLGTKSASTTAASGTTGSTPKVGGAGSVKEEKGEDKEDKVEEKEVTPVGQEYIEEIRNDEGKILSFNCKLCECRFNDPNAKEMHMKGRRHRLQYKKKVDPDLPVDIKPSLRQKKIQEDRLRRQHMRDEFFRFPLPPPGPRPFLPGPPMMHPMLRRPETMDDRHVLAKHADIYPREDELNAIQAIVSHGEKALKAVSDFIADTDAPKDTATTTTPPATTVKVKEEKDAEKKDKDKKEKEKENGGGDSKESGAGRVLRGVMRVGPLAKGLLLRGDTACQLVVLCSEKPTRTLLERVVDNLPKQLAIVAADCKYELKRCVEEAAIIMMSTCEPKVSVTITLTSPIMREQPQETTGDQQNQVPTTKDPPDVLDKNKCLDALAELRHSKWFQARANCLQSCVLIMRILRELCQRVPIWAPLNTWALELLVERVLASAPGPLSPGDALRRVIEALASGILLPGGPGLMDPCEKDPTDATSILTPQEREDITSSAQHALRLMAFRQIHKVLGMDMLPLPKRIVRFTRKRRRDNSAGESVDGKKDKKEAEEMETEIKKEK